jgi:biopolymer transport protein ExbD
MIIPRRQFTCTIPTFAMGDIGFLLLIFFVILARVQNDSHIQWTPAQSETVAPAAAARASVAIDSGRKIYLDGRETSADALADALTAILGDAPEGSRRIHLKVDRDTPAVIFEPVIEAISEAGGELTHILETKTPEP